MVIEADAKKAVVDCDVVGKEEDRNHSFAEVEMDVMDVDDLLVQVDYFHYRSGMNGDLVDVEKEDYIPRLVEGHWRRARGEGRHLGLIVEEVVMVEVFESGSDLEVGDYLKLACFRSFARPVLVRHELAARPGCSSYCKPWSQRH